ncbi:hypothetical protein KJ966_11585 [bacterium]|nr:hypothetical protein [bacterium]
MGRLVELVLPYNVTNEFTGAHRPFDGCKFNSYQNINLKQKSPQRPVILVLALKTLRTMIDYSKYSISELLDVKNNIDKDKAQESYTNLLKELEKRKERVAEHNEEEEYKLGESIKAIIYVYAITQFISFLVLIILEFYDFYPLNSTEITDNQVTDTLFRGLALVLNLFSGYGLIKKKKYGLYLSFANQMMQSISFQLKGFFYFYSGIWCGYFNFMSSQSVNLNIYRIGKLEYAKPGFLIQTGLDPSITFLSINLIAVFFLVILFIYGRLGLANESVNQKAIRTRIEERQKQSLMNKIKNMKTKK